MMTDQPQPPKRPAEEVLRSHPPRPPVRRLRPAAVALVLGGLALVFGGRLVISMLDQQADRADENELIASRMRARDDMLERGPIGQLPSDYSFLPPPAKPKPEPVVEAPAPEPEEPPVEIDPETRRRLEALRKELEAAMDSPVGFPDVWTMHRTNVWPVPGPSGPSNVGGDATLAFGDPAGTDSNARFMRGARDVETHVNATLQRPRSPYEIKAGTVIPAALVTAINSDLPGDIVGQVTANVYDSVSGRFLLVPQGTRLIGRYNSEVLKGQNRILIAWQRMILPNGDSMVLEAMPGTDAAGVAGMADRVDHHLARLAGATLLSTLIALGGNLATRGNRGNESLDIVGATVAQQASRTGQRIIDRELDLRPTITIRAGMAFNVLVNRDLVLAPYTAHERR